MLLKMIQELPSQNVQDLGCTLEEYLMLSRRGLVIPWFDGCLKDDYYRLGEISDLGYGVLNGWYVCE